MSSSRPVRSACAIVASAAVALALTGGRPTGAHPGKPHFSAASTTIAPARPADRPVPAASRSHLRSRGPHLVPPPMAKTTSCRLTLPGGVWALDVTAARTLTMITAAAYRTDRSVSRAALAFEHTLTWHTRYVPGPIGSVTLLKRKHKNMVPHTWAVDAVLALYSPHSLFCAQPWRTDLKREPMLTNGLTNRAQTLLFAWWAAYGGRPVGGFDPHGITEGHIEDSAHYDARAVDISFPTSDPENNRRGWLLAHWLVAQADYYSIATIIFDDHIWSRLHSTEGWRPYTHPSGDTTNPTLRHLDHVHVDVVQGYPEGPPVSVVAEEQQQMAQRQQAAATAAAARQQVAQRRAQPERTAARSAPARKPVAPPARPQAPARPPGPPPAEHVPAPAKPLLPQAKPAPAGPLPSGPPAD